MTAHTTLTDWQSLFDRLTPEERDDITLLMVGRIEACRRATLAALMASPRRLELLPVSQLREVVDVGIEEAHAALVAAFPDHADVLVALECLTAFSVSKDEPTAADMRDVVSSLEDVWKASGGNYIADLVETPAVPSKEKPSESVTVGAAHDSRSHPKPKARRHGRQDKGSIPAAVSTATKGKRA